MMPSPSRFLLHASCLLISLGGPACAPTDDQAAAVKRPSYTLTVSDTFRAASIPAYQGAHAETYAYIDANKAKHLENMKRWVRQRSVSAQNDGIQEMARLVMADLKALGFKETALVPTDGHPSVWGYYDAGAAKTLAVYMMYDV
ncbi:MAG: M20/M25/M40 family metallo-hydrolase, partial [Gemmatimonadaceae bacterium]